MASQGAIFALNIINSKNLDDDISFLKKNNYQIYGTSLKNAANLNDIDTKIDKLAIILGNEGNGVNPKLLELTDKNIKIEMDNIDSLNVAMAGAILMYNFRKIS